MITFPSIPPDQTSSENPNVSSIFVQFGNGYFHNLPDGSNNVRTDWNPMTWSGLTSSDLGTINTFLTNMGKSGDYTTYTSAMTGATYYLIIPPGAWQITNQGGSTFTVQAQFKQLVL